jgi:hypothetical protein
MMLTPNLQVQGLVKITDKTSGQTLVDTQNAIAYENISIALAESLADSGQGYIYEMVFGNGGSAVDPTGVITYLPPNVSGINAALYNQTFAKVVNVNSPLNTDPTRNRITTFHTAGRVYTDVLVTCLLDYGEPAGQQAFDNSTNFNGEYVFDELGLKVWRGNGQPLLLITHVIFHPVQKSLNRQIQIDYTVRIQTLTNLSAT